MSEHILPQEPGCFDHSSAVYSKEIKNFINDEINDSYYYLYLSQKAPQSAVRTLRRISAEERDHARRFSSALYLITGERYFPKTPDIKPSDIPPYITALRQRFRAETRGAAEYERFARKIRNDRCLERLAIETGKSEEDHASKIYMLIQETDR